MQSVLKLKSTPAVCYHLETQTTERRNAMTNHISLASKGLTYTANRLEVGGKPAVTVRVNDNQPEGKLHYPINGTLFTFAPRTVTVTNTFTESYTGLEKTFTLYSLLNRVSVLVVPTSFLMVDSIVSRRQPPGWKTRKL
jgi:hypothetical protein